MLIHETPLAGTVLSELHKMAGARGLSARSFRRSEFEKAGREPAVTQGEPVASHRMCTPPELSADDGPATYFPRNVAHAAPTPANGTEAPAVSQ
ncbi:hypothetical protein OG528_27945 [Streptomyces platensis]|uniref:hypothetical protein n=1 Tax=Streptomyces platensis TaxID=58346 RepID=UPI0030E13B28